MKDIFVSVIMPCRNEATFIRKCLDSVIAQDYPRKKIEVIIIDGKSDDKTYDILKEYQERYAFISVLINEGKTTPKALNIGIKRSRGELVIRMDAHNVYKSDYENNNVFV